MKTANNFLFLIISVLSIFSGLIQANEYTITVTGLKEKPVPTTRYTQEYNNCYCPL